MASHILRLAFVVCTYVRLLCKDCPKSVTRDHLIVYRQVSGATPDVLPVSMGTESVGGVVSSRRQCAGWFCQDHRINRINVAYN